MAAAFYPQGPTILIALTTVGSVAVCPSSAAGLQGLKIDNLSTNNVFLNVSSTGAVALLPTTAAGQTGMFIPYLASLTITTPPNPFVSALTTGAALVSVMALTLGAGID